MTWLGTQCGGTQWRELGNGQLEIEGGGVPMVHPGDALFTYLEQTWNNWAPEFREVARETGVPASELLAISTAETGLWAKNPERQRTITSTDGHSSVGITQPLAQTAQSLGFHPDDRFDPYKNILMAALLAQRNIERYGRDDFPVWAASHNAGGVRCSPGRNRWNMIMTGDYLGKVIAFNNSAIEYLDVDAGGLNLATMAGVGLAAAGVAVAYLVLIGRGPRWLAA
jgi:hypothetical protein